MGEPGDVWMILDDILKAELIKFQKMHDAFAPKNYAANYKTCDKYSLLELCVPQLSKKPVKSTYFRLVIKG